VSEIANDFVLLFLRKLLVALFAAIATVFERFEHLGVLSFRLALHLLFKRVFVALKLTKQTLLLLVVVMAFRNLDFHLLTFLLHLELLLRVLLVELTQNGIDLLFFFHIVGHHLSLLLLSQNFHIFCLNLGLSFADGSRVE